MATQRKGWSLPEAGSMSRWLATQHALRGWRADGALSDSAHDRAAALLGRHPSIPAWRAFLERLSVLLGALMLGAGVVCFVAYNWNELGRFAKFYGLQLLLIACAAVAWKLGPARTAGRAVLLLGGIVIGALLALIGQTYQTGADTYELFLAWALLLLPWALAAHWAPLWLLWVLVANAALYLWADTGSGWGLVRLFWRNGGIFAFAMVFNAVLLAAWEWLAGTRFAVAGRYGPRLVLLAVLAPLLIGAIAAITGAFDDDGVAPTHLALALLVMAAAFAFYRWRRPDLAALAALALAAIAIVTTLLGKLLFEARLYDAAWLLLSLTVIGLAVGAAMWLLRLRREMRDVDA